MPKLYEYLGLIIFFYVNEHEPIHVHARNGKYESKAELIIKNGKLIEIKFVPVRGRKPLRATEMKKFKNVVQNRPEDIINKWIDFFVFNKSIKMEKIISLK